MFIKHKILSIQTINYLRAYMHACAHTCTHTPHKYTGFSKLNLHKTSVDSRGLRQRKTASGNGMEKRGRLIITWFDLKSWAGFCWRGSGSHSMEKGQRQKRHGNQHWEVWYKESGGWLEYRKQSGEYGRVCKVEKSHNKYPLYPLHLNSALILYCWLSHTKRSGKRSSVSFYF